MTDITPYQPAAQVARVDAQTIAVQRLTEWAHSADAAYAIAEKLVQSSFVPVGFKGKPVEATAAILAGLEIGLQPMAALRSFDVIQGQAAPRAITLRAVVQSYGHEMVLVESNNTRCKMRGLRRGSTEWQSVTWTIDRAKDLGLTGKDNWKKQPGAMLVARATGELARLIAADAILGIAYTAEEIADGGNVEQAVASESVDATPSGTRKMSRKPKAQEPEPAPEPAPEPDFDPVAATPDPEPEPDTQPMTPRTRGQLFALFAEQGIEDRDEQIRGIAHIIGHPIESRSQLTEDEARAVVLALKARSHG